MDKRNLQQLPARGGGDWLPLEPGLVLRVQQNMVEVRLHEVWSPGDSVAFIFASWKSAPRLRMRRHTRRSADVLSQQPGPLVRLVSEASLDLLPPLPRSSDKRAGDLGSQPVEP